MEEDEAPSLAEDLRAMMLMLMEIHSIERIEERIEEEYGGEEEEGPDA